jgi:3-oxoacyl-[acyl-carrier protein] reductase
MDLGLTGKSAAISGGSQGLGNAIANSLANEGCNVAISARGEERLNQAVEELSAKGVKAVGIQCDMSTSDGCKSFIDGAVAGLGGLDILVNNVGGMTPGTLESLTDEQWREIMDRNLMAHVWSTKFAVEHLGEGASILNISGISGKQLLPGSLSTTLPNSAINGFSKVMAGELAPKGVRVNNLCPGIIDTEAWGPRREIMGRARGVTGDEIYKMFAGLALMDRWGKPEEIGNIAAFLVSDKNSFMTGSTVEACGGFTKYI